MRGTLIFITLLALLGFFAVVSEAKVVDGEKTTPFLSSLPNNRVDHDVSFVPEVDRGDDPVEALLCSAKPNDCSLRQAILLANQSGEAQAIGFADHYMIVLTRPLPPITQNGTHIVAPRGLEVHVNGNNQLGPVFHIAAADVRLEGLRIFGAGASYPNILVNGPSRNVVIARNVIGDDDAPNNNCGQNQQASAGILIQANTQVMEGVHTWVVGNIIECHMASSADGLIIRASSVMVGVDPEGQASPAQRNIIRWNQGAAVRLDDYGGNTIRNNRIHDNAGGVFAVTNYTNNFIDNEIN